MAYLEYLKSKREQILETARNYGAHNLRVFGSVAKGDDSLTSDIDMLVDLEPGRSLLDHIALKQDLEDILGRSVDVVTEPSLHWFIRESVIREAKPL